MPALRSTALPPRRLAGWLSAWRSHLRGLTQPGCPHYMGASSDELDLFGLWMTRTPHASRGYLPSCGLLDGGTCDRTCVPAPRDVRRVR